jgi:hypothetical protein
VITLSRHTPADQHPGALAYAMPYERTHIVVFYDRVSKQVNCEWAPSVLAYALVHEIAHILQGAATHSARGIMKARWEYLDLAEMQKGTLGFTKVDLVLIRAGMAKRAASALVPTP